MVKKLAIVVVILAVLAGVAAYLVYNRLDVIAHYLIEKYGSEIAAVDVKVKDVELNPADGKGGLRGVEIGSPKGFNAPRTARLGEIRVRLDPKTVTGDVIVIHEITIVAPEINYEKGAKGGSNLETIQKNIEGYLARSGTPADDKAPGPSSPGRRYVIEKFSITGARVTMTNPALKGQGIAFTLPDIQVTNLGRKPNGITAGQAANIITNLLIQRIAQRLLTNLDALRKGGTEGAFDALKKLVR